MFGISPDSMRGERSTRSVDITKHGNIHRRIYRNQPEKAKTFLDKFRKEKTVGERIRENADSAGYTVTEKNPDKEGPGLIAGIAKGVQRMAAAKEKDERRVDVSKHGNLHRRRNRSLKNLK